jgi:ABC-type multidrug transport system ATPase subunit
VLYIAGRSAPLTRLWLTVYYSCLPFFHSHQDDIVYPELTVRENLIFSGKFQLPKGTPLEEIEDLADATMASLGLSRVMHSIVGDVHRRGVSGGERKRVNIGLELMVCRRRMS